MIKNTSKKLDHTNVTFPVAQKDYRKMEIMNNININVFGYEKQEPYPVYISKEKFNDMLNLLLIIKGKEQHYALIKDFNKFMYNQTKHARRKHSYMRYLQRFKSEIVLNNYTENCIIINGAQAIKMPKADDMVHFKNYHKGLATPFVIYADFEAINEKVHGCHQIMINHIPNYIRSVKTVDIAIKLSVAMMISIVNQFRYIEENAVLKFMEKMLEEIEWYKKMKHKHFNKDMILTKDDEINFKNYDKCYICYKKYSAKDIRVRDHCQITGKYRGSVHQDRNINYRLTDNIHVIFHNFKGYDSHFIMQTTGEIANKHT